MPALAAGGELNGVYQPGAAHEQALQNSHDGLLNGHDDCWQTPDGTVGHEVRSKPAENIASHNRIWERAAVCRSVHHGTPGSRPHARAPTQQRVSATGPARLARTCRRSAVLQALSDGETELDAHHHNVSTDGTSFPASVRDAAMRALQSSESVRRRLVSAGAPTAAPEIYHDAVRPRRPQRRVCPRAAPRRHARAR
jgi:hypothetical protein